MSLLDLSALKKTIDVYTISLKFMDVVGKPYQQLQGKND